MLVAALVGIFKLLDLEQHDYNNRACGCEKYFSFWQPNISVQKSPYMTSYVTKCFLIPQIRKI